MHTAHLPQRSGRHARQLTKCRAAPVLALLLLAFQGACLASEYGVSSYRPGLMDVYAGLLPPPGTLMVKSLFLYQSASSRAITEDGRLEVGAKTDIYNEAIMVGYVTRFSILGGRYAFGTIQMARIADQNAHVGPLGVHMPDEQLTVGGLGDAIFLPIILGWDFGRLHLAGNFAFYAPTGHYNPNQIISTGLNRWAFEPDLGITWLDDSGREASIFLGYTVNTVNPADHYQSGDEFHADFAFVRHFRDGFMFGTSGYALQQTTADSGSSAKLGSYEGRVIALGPIGGYTLRIGEKAVDLSLKYDFEFDAQNRLSGNELWFTTTFHL